MCYPYSPADKVSDDVGMTHEDLCAVLFLGGRSSVEVATERCFDSGIITEELLTKRKEESRRKRVRWARWRENMRQRDQIDSTYCSLGNV